MKAKTILIIGTLDTKEEEILFVKEQIEERGCKVILKEIRPSSFP